MSLTIKTEFKRSNGEADIRRTRLIDGSDRYLQLINYLDSTYGQVYGIAKSAYVLSYVDPDGDACSINSDAELLECCRCAADESKTAKIKVKVADDMSSTLSQLSISRSVSQASSRADAPSPVNAAVSVSQPGSSPQPSAPEVDSDSEYVQVDSSRPGTPEAAPVASDSTPEAAVAPVVPTEANPVPSVTVEDETEEERDENALVEAIIASFTGPSLTTPLEQKSVVVPSVFTTVTSTVAEVQKEESKVDSTAGSQSSVSNSGVHRHVICDGCGTSPIVGDRFKCSICHDFDLCLTCEKSGKSFGRHSAQHSMIKMPAPGAGCGRVYSVSKTPAGASPSGTSSSASASGADVHAGVRCDVCLACPIQGVRYKCTSCHDYDLCGNCEAKNEHDPKHVLLKMRHHLTGEDVQNAIMNRVSHWWRRGGHHHMGGGRGMFGGGRHCGGFRARSTEEDANRPRAAFISDTVSDGAVVAPGSTFQKVWSIQNTGDKAWPENCKLVFVGGDLTSADQSGTPVDHSVNSVPVSAQPGETVNVKMDIVAPLEEGRFRSTFRLMTAQNERFGPRMWIDVNVRATDSASAPSVFVPASQPASVQDSTPAAPAASALPVAEPVQPQDPIRGAIQTLVSALGPALTQQGGNSSAVQSFFDLIQGHGRNTPRSQQPAPAVVAQPDPFRYQAELITIRDMGVDASDDTLKRLLTRFNGNVSRTLTQVFEGSE